MVGDSLLVPGGFCIKAMKPFVLLLERVSDDSYRVSVINPGLNEGYHMSDPNSAPPKIQTRFSMTFDNVPKSKV